MIYLDNAATSFPKPVAVCREVKRVMTVYGGNPGRGMHQLSIAAAEKIYSCRERIARLFGSDHPERVCFTLNTTSALNLAIKGLLQKGDHVLISDMEHNAVWRPIEKLAKEGMISYDVFPTFAADPNRSAARICTAIARLRKVNTKMLICAHASNICSSCIPLEDIGRLCKRHGILFVVDAAQSAGHLPIDITRAGIDALCAPGHKGLLGPQGSGFVLWGNDTPIASTLIEGGSGFQSLNPEMPSESPERFEAGTLPTPAVAGLWAGIGEIERIGLEEIHAHEEALYQRLLELMSEERDITVYAPHACGSVLLFNLNGISADLVGRDLDRRGIFVRCGYHCAALAHKSLQTPVGGAVRVSFGYSTAMADIDKLMEALREIKSNA